MAVPGLITGAAIGLLAMYVFDPDAGRRRRALARDQVDRLRTQTRRAATVTGRDLRNRAGGLAAEVRGFIFGQETDDRALEERVRSHLGFLVRHPAAITVTATDGRVVLTGPVLADEVQQLMRGVKSVRGVMEVENRLDVHDSPDQVPALQGDVPKPAGERLDVFQRHWAPSTRLLVGSVGALLLLKLGLVRKSSAAVATLAAAGWLACKARGADHRRRVPGGASAELRRASWNE